MKLIDILNNITYKKFIGNENIEINDFSKDTRTIKQGDIYIGIKGENFDGNSFWKKAFENGASACILDNIEINDEVYKYIDDSKGIIVVENTIDTISEYAGNLRNKLSIPVIAVTGSAGKTSTKDIIASIVSTKYKTLKSEQNFNNNIGCPLSITRYKDEEVMILEMGAQYIGEIDSYCKYARPNIAVITNVGTAHIGKEFFNGRENILKAKTEVINYMDEKGILIINNDNDMLHKFYKENNKKIKIITIGIENKSDIMPTDINIYEEYSTFKIDDTLIKVPISGIHFIYNVLEAIAIARILDISLEDVQKGLNNLEMSNNRMSITKSNGLTIINDAYNANCEAMKYAIKYLGNMKGRKIAILGSMLELGDFTKTLHEEVAKEVIENNIDIVISIGKEMEYLHNYLIKENTENIYHFDNKEGIVDLVNNLKKEGDNILIKGSNGLRLFELIDDLSK